MSRPRVDAQRVLAPVVGKARRYLRVSTALMAGLLALSAAVGVAMAYQDESRQQNFDNNTNLHVITVSQHLASGSPDALRLADVDAITSLLARSGLSGAIVSPELGLGGGLSEGSTPVVIVGIDARAGSLVGTPSIADGVGYTVDGPNGTADLDVPVVSMNNPDGVISNRLARFSLPIRPILDKTKVEFLAGHRQGRLVYVSTATFWRIAEVMFAESRDKVIASYEAGALPMTPLVSGVYVDVPDIGQVRRVASALDISGYYGSYALQAFDDVESSLQAQRRLGAALGVAVLLGVGAYLTLSWRSYLRLSRRDIGIMKQWGVDHAQIRRAYRRRLGRSLAVPLIVAEGICLVGAAVLIHTSGTTALVGWLALILGVIVGALFLLIDRFLIRGTVRTPTLQLLQLDREFQ